MTPPSRVEVIVTPGCHLCENACDTVAAVCDDVGVVWRRVALSALTEERQREWRDYVPVILVDGTVHDIFRVDATRLREALRT